MKVAYLLQNPGMNLSKSRGTQIHISGVLKGLESTGMTVDVMAIDRRDVYRVKGSHGIGAGKPISSERIKIGSMRKFAFKLMRAGSWRLQKVFDLPYLALWDSLYFKHAIEKTCTEYDVLHGHFDLVPMGAYLGSSRLDKPLVIDCEADWFDEWRFQGRKINPILERWARRWQKRYFDAADAIICVSERLRDHLVEEWDLPDGKLHVIQNGVDVEQFRPLPAESGFELRRRLGLQDKPTIVFVGSFAKRHGLEDLIESFAIVLDHIPECTLLLVGDGQLRGEVETLTEEKAVKSSVLFTGNVELSEIPQLLSIADVAVSPSIDVQNGSTIKTSPLKLLEYMAAGKASVVTAIGQSKEIVDHGKDGLLVSPNDIPALAEAMLTLVKDPDLSRNMGLNARRKVLENYTWSHYGDEVKRIYRTIL